MAMSNGAKVGLVAAVGIGAFLLAGGSSSAAGVSAKPIDPCSKNPPDCASLTACAAKIMPIATKGDVPTLQQMSTAAKLLGCADLAKQLDTLIKTLSGSGGSTKPTTKLFSPAAAKDATRAHNLAVAFGTSLVPPDWASAHPGDVADNGTFKDWAAYARYNNATASAQFAMTQFQDAAGLSTDGVAGTETQKAMAYWWGHTSVSGESSPLRHNHRTSVGSESVAGCSACDAKHGAVAGNSGIENPESFGPYNTVVDHDEGYVKFDRAFGSSFGAGSPKSYLGKRRFGTSARFGV